MKAKRMGNRAKVIRLIITDDHKILRQGLISLLDRYEDIEVVGEAANGEELLQLLAHTPADVVLMDINMPVMDGLQATRSIAAQYPATKVIALSMLNDLPFIYSIIENGASGYLLKSVGKEELISAIKLVHSGTPYICSDVSIKMLDTTKKPAAEPKSTVADEKSILSKRELEVLRLIAEGFTNAEIAEKLFTSKRTIETHRQNIIEKTQTKNTANLIKYAIQHKLIEIDGEG